MKRRRYVLRRGDLRIAAATLAIFGLAILLNQPSHSTVQPSWMRTWTDTTVLRLNLPEPSREAMPAELPPWTAAPAIHTEAAPQPRLARADQYRKSRPAVFEWPTDERAKFRIP